MYAPAAEHEADRWELVGDAQLLDESCPERRLLRQRQTRARVDLDGRPRARLRLVLLQVGLFQLLRLHVAGLIQDARVILEDLEERVLRAHAPAGEQVLLQRHRTSRTHTSDASLLMLSNMHT